MLSATVLSESWLSQILPVLLLGYEIRHNIQENRACPGWLDESKSSGRIFVMSVRTSLVQDLKISTALSIFFPNIPRRTHGGMLSIAWLYWL